VRLAPKILVGAADEILGMGVNPGMIERHVVGHEIEHQPQAALLQARPQARQRAVAAEEPVNGVAGNRKTGSGDVVIAKVRERFAKFGEPFGVAARHALGGCAGLPDAQQPDPIEPKARDPIERLVGEIVQRRRPAEVLCELCQPDPGVDLIEGRIPSGAHSFAPRFRRESE
jgi:hypothetical protein